LAFTNYDAIIAALTAGKQDHRSIFKGSQTADAAGVPVFTWRGAGTPAAGAVPATGSGTVPTRDTTGAIYMANGVTANTAYFLKYGVGGATQGTSWLVDVCWFNSGLSGTVITAQTINSLALTRYTTGEDLLIALICWTATGTTASNVTVSYTNQDGTAGRTTTSVAFWTGGYGGGALAPTADQVQLLPLQAGDRGARSIQSLTLSASTLTAGNFGVMLLKRLAVVSYEAARYNERDLVLQTSNLPQKIDSACLSTIHVPNGTSTGLWYGNIHVVWE